MAPSVAEFTFALKTLRCERVFPLRSTRCVLSVLEIIDGPTLKVQRVECEGTGIAPTLSRPLRGLRQGVAQLETRNKKEARRAQCGVSVELRVGGPKAAKRPRPERAIGGCLR